MAKRKHKSKRKRDDLEPLDQLSNKREEVGELIKQAKVADCTNNSPVNYDIEHNIREIRAILKMNAEILDRCKDFMEETEIIEDDDGADSSSSSLFKRIAYEVVTARAWNEGTQVITHPVRTTNEFNTTPLSKLPEGLDGIIVSDNMTEDKFSSFINFGAFFEKSLILHDTVLEQFLPKLKEHLMSIQVCLGEIDAWVIQEPQKNISFLEETFKQEMEMPDDNVTLGRHQCRCGTHLPNEICLKCGNQYGGHAVWHSLRTCPSGLSNWVFECEYYQVLMQCNGNGKHEMTFNLNDEKEKTKLKKLLDLIASD
jgi:hypothetical protein